MSSEAASVRSRLASRVLGPPGHQRVRVSQTLLALLAYALFALLQQSEVSLGMVDARASRWLTTYNLAGAVGFYLLIRSGANQRLSRRDPSLTLPQSLFALTSITWSYAITGPARGAVMCILVLVIVFGMFRLTPRQSRGLAMAGFGMLAAVMAWRAVGAPAVYDPRVELVHFVFAAIVIGATAALSIRLGRLRARLSEQKAELERALDINREMATRDALTGLLNRRAMLELLQQEQPPRAPRAGGATAVALIDLDWFKRINDTHGHGVGDAVLQRFAERAREVLRGGDALARWGGEEFLVLMPGATREAGLAVMERLQQRLAATSAGLMPAGLAVSFSAGVVQWADGESADTLVERADHAMYRAKTGGRARSEVG